MYQDVSKRIKKRDQQQKFYRQNHTKSFCALFRTIRVNQIRKSRWKPNTSAGNYAAIRKVITWSQFALNKRI